MQTRRDQPLEIKGSTHQDEPSDQLDAYDPFRPLPPEELYVIAKMQAEDREQLEKGKVEHKRMQQERKDIETAIQESAGESKTPAELAAKSIQINGKIEFNDTEIKWHTTFFCENSLTTQKELSVALKNAILDDVKKEAAFAELKIDHDDISLIYQSDQNNKIISVNTTVKISNSQKVDLYKNKEDDIFHTLLPITTSLEPYPQNLSEEKLSESKSQKSENDIVDCLSSLAKQARSTYPVMPEDSIRLFLADHPHLTHFIFQYYPITESPAVKIRRDKILEATGSFSNIIASIIAHYEYEPQTKYDYFPLPKALITPVKHNGIKLRSPSPLNSDMFKNIQLPTKKEPIIKFELKNGYEGYLHGISRLLRLNIIKVHFDVIRHFGMGFLQIEKYHVSEEKADIIIREILDSGYFRYNYQFILKTFRGMRAGIELALQFGLFSDDENNRELICHIVSSMPHPEDKIISDNEFKKRVKLLKEYAEGFSLFKKYQTLAKEIFYVVSKPLVKSEELLRYQVNNLLKQYRQKNGVIKSDAFYDVITALLKKPSQYIVSSAIKFGMFKDKIDDQKVIDSLAIDYFKFLCREDKPPYENSIQNTLKSFPEISKEAKEKLIKNGDFSRLSVRGC